MELEKWKSEKVPQVDVATQDVSVDDSSSSSSDDEEPKKLVDGDL